MSIRTEETAADAADYSAGCVCGCSVVVPDCEESYRGVDFGGQDLVVESCWVRDWEEEGVQAGEC